MSPHRFYARQRLRRNAPEDLRGTGRGRDEPMGLSRVRSLDQNEYFLAEVYYTGDKLGSVGDPRNCLRWDRFDDLEGTVDLIRQAFNKPVLEVAADGCLVKEAPG